MNLLYKPFSIVGEAIISLLLLIDSAIYGVFARLYSIYLELAMARIFDIHSFDTLIDNVYVIFGVVALFIVAFSLIQTIVNPDDNSKGTKAIFDILKRIVICIGATCLVPFFFDFLYDVQYSVLSWQVIPRTMIGVGKYDMVDLNGSYIDENGIAQQVTISATVTDVAKAQLQRQGNQLAFSVLNGFLYPNDLNNDGYQDNVIVSASEFFDTGTGVGMAIVGCIIGVAVTGILVISGVGIPAGAATAVGTATICAGGALAGIVINGTLVTLTAENFAWFYVTDYLVIGAGAFDWITPFSQGVLEGTMTYTPIISSIAGCILVYMLFSFCLDLGVRAAKLIFYQIMAPISFLLSIIPKNKDLMMNWFKLVITTWSEVFVRIICVCGAALLISNLNFSELRGVHLISRAIIALGVVAFAKQAPKLFSEVTGIKSGNMKLGIKNKLSEAMSGVPGVAAVGTLAKKTISGIDAKRNGQNFADGWRRIEGKGPIASTKKWINGMLPYSAANAENRRKADEQRKALSSKVAKGQKSRDFWTNKIMENDEYRDDFLALKDENGNFILDDNGEKTYRHAESGDYIRYLAATDTKYEELGMAYQNRGTAKKNMLSAKAEFEAAQQSGDAALISAAAKKYNEYKDSYEAFDQEWKQLIGSSKFKKENEIFSSMKYIEDRNKGLVSEPNGNGYQATRQSQSEVSPEPIEKPKIEIVSSSGSGPRKENSSQEQQNINEAHSQLVKQYDEAKTPEERSKIKKQIEEFEKKH